MKRKNNKMMFVERTFFQNNKVFRIVMILCISIISLNSFAQQSKEQTKELKAAQNYLSEAQQMLQKEKFPDAEANYRQAISLNPKDETAKYNLGTAYYGKEKNAEAMLRFKQAAVTATTKADKHRAFHNLGNTYMNEKKYTEAVESYKNALRNNPNDDETRYNLALAKDLLDKNPPPPEDQNDKNDDKNEDNNEDNNDQDNQDKQDQDDKNKDGDKGDEGDQKDDKDKGDQKDKKDEGDKDKDEGKSDKPKDSEGDKPQQQQPVPGQLSPQQVKSLLEAMNNEEKKTQEKINAEKQKGAKVKSDKDW